MQSSCKSSLTCQFLSALPCQLSTAASLRNPSSWRLLPARLQALEADPSSTRWPLAQGAGRPQAFLLPGQRAFVTLPFPMCTQPAEQIKGNPLNDQLPVSPRPLVRLLQRVTPDPAHEQVHYWGKAANPSRLAEKTSLFPSTFIVLWMSGNRAQACFLLLCQGRWGKLEVDVEKGRKRADQKDQGK